MFSFMGVVGGVVFFLTWWLLLGEDYIIGMSGGLSFAIIWYVLSRLVKLPNK